MVHIVIQKCFSRSILSHSAWLRAFSSQIWYAQPLAEPKSCRDYVSLEFGDSKNEGLNEVTYRLTLSPRRAKADRAVDEDNRFRRNICEFI